MLHAERADYGISGRKWVEYVLGLITAEKHRTALDYGCGKGTLKEGLSNADCLIHEYDPCIDGKDATPEPADLVICTDVLEHIEPKLLNAVLRDLARVTRRKLFLNISTAPSSKFLPDGRNAHLIVKDAHWWREKIGQYFRIALWQYREFGNLVFGECLPKRKPFIRPKVRRAMHPDWLGLIDQIKTYNHKYTDAFARLHSFNMWEGVDDKPADMQVVVNTLHDTDDFDAELKLIIQHAQKAVMIMVPITLDLTEEFWRRLFEKNLRIGDWHKDIVEGQHRLVCVGSPMVGVQGVTAVGAMASDDRWEQVKAASARIPKRIIVAPPHDRRAILACYGPSLKTTIDVLRDEAEQTGAAIISVSGAHDFLIERGIVPTYHVECDPRPHKADNIDRPILGVQYLIGSGVHPVFFDKLCGTGNHDRTGMDVSLWHISTPEHASRIIDELGENSDCLISGGGSVGLRAIPLLYNMGYRDISIYGMDCSFSEDGSSQWAGKHAGKRQDLCEVICGERIFCSSPILLTYATGFFETVQRVTDMTIRLYGDGLLQNMCRLHEGAPHLCNIAKTQ